jgi:DNA-binding response OmpR family regulator
MPRVLVAASELSRLESLEAALARDGFTLVVAAPERIVERARDERPSIVLLGLHSRGSSSADACRALRADPGTERVMIVVASPREEDIEQALDAGADYFVVSPFRERALLACFRAVLRRTREAPLHRVLTLGGLEIDPNKRRASVDGKEVALTPTEYELLHFLARHPGRTFARAELVKRVLGTDDARPEAIEVQVSRLRDKLGPVGPLIVTVRGSGYRFMTEKTAENVVRRRRS